MNDITNLSNVTGANIGLAQSTASGRSAPPEPAAVQQAVAQPVTTSQSSVTQSSNASGADWQRNAHDNYQQQHLAQAQSGVTPTRQQVDDTINDLNQRLRHYNTALEFDVDDKYDKMVVRVVDQNTHEVVRQIPPEGALAFAQFFDELEEQQARESPATHQGLGSSDSLRLKMEGMLFQTKI